MLDVSRELKKVRDEISKFQETIHTKMLEREKLAAEIKNIGDEVLKIRSLEKELSLKRSLLGRLDFELTRLRMQKMRLDREVPNMERELAKFHF